MLNRIRRIFRSASKPLGALWRWAKKPKLPGRVKRWRALSDWARRKWRKAQRGEAKAAWAVRKRVYRKRYRAAKKRLEEQKKPTFEPWMANGRPYSGLNDRLRSAIAYAVVKHDLYVTSTKRWWGTSSWHEVWKAIDVAGAYSRMVAFQKWLAQHRGPTSLEVFGPAPFYYKNGVRVNRPFPDHGDHDHYADN